MGPEACADGNSAKSNSTDNIPMGEAAAELQELCPDNKIPWIVEQLSLCNIHISEGKLEESGMAIFFGEVLEEKNKVTIQNRKLMDDYSRVRTQLNAHIRDKQSHSDLLASMRQEVRATQGRVAALQQEQRENRNRWVEEKADLENKVFQMLAVQTQVQGSLRKKEKDHEKLQAQLTKAVRESNKASKSMIQISKPIKQNSSQKNTAERVEANAAALRATEVASLRNYVHQLEQETAAARSAHQTALAAVEARMAAAAKQAQQQMAELVMEHERALQTQPHAALLVANQAEHEEGDGEVDLNETWNEVGSPMPAESPAPGALVEEFLLPLTPTPHAVQVLEEVARAAAAEAVFRSPNPSSGADTLAMRQQLQEALAVIREQDRLIQEAIMGKLPSWQTSTDARANSGGVSTLVGSSSTPNRAGQEEGRAQCPDSIMKILAPGRGVNKENGPVASLNANALLSPEPMLAALEQEIFDEASPCTQNMLRATGICSSAEIAPA